VCNRLPLKLSLDDTSHNKAAELFPNATSLTLASCHMNRKWHGFRNMNNLKHLNLESISSWSVAELSEQDLKSLLRLQSLEITIDNEELLEDFYSSLSTFSSLTCLKISAPKPRSFVIQSQPEIFRIEHLKLRSTLLFDSDGQLVFPSLTNLTNLDILVDSETMSFEKGFLDIIAIHASTLRNLSLCLCLTEDGPPDLSSWNAFYRLESFSIDALGRERPSLSIDNLDGEYDFLLWGMHSLIELNIGRVAVMTDNLLETVSKLRTLRRFSFIFNLSDAGSHLAASGLHQLTHLTRLEVTNPPPQKSFSPLTGLIELSIKTERSTGDDLSEAIAGMFRLEKLSLSCCGRALMMISSNTFAGLTNLKSLSLQSVAVDKDLICTLARLPELTTFQFNPHVEQSENLTFAHQITALTGLIKLSLGDGFDADMLCGYTFRGSFPRLRWLSINEDRTERERNRMKELYPSLRYVCSNWETT